MNCIPPCEELTTHLDLCLTNRHDHPRQKCEALRGTTDASGLSQFGGLFVTSVAAALLRSSARAGSCVFKPLMVYVAGRH